MRIISEQKLPHVLFQQVHDEIQAQGYDSSVQSFLAAAAAAAAACDHVAVTGGRLAPVATDAGASLLVDAPPSRAIYIPLRKRVNSSRCDTELTERISLSIPLPKKCSLFFFLSVRDRELSQTKMARVSCWESGECIANLDRTGELQQNVFQYKII